MKAHFAAALAFAAFAFSAPVLVQTAAAQQAEADTGSGYYPARKRAPAPIDAPAPPEDRRSAISEQALKGGPASPGLRTRTFASPVPAVRQAQVINVRAEPVPAPGTIKLVRGGEVSTARTKAYDHATPRVYGAPAPLTAGVRPARTITRFGTEVVEDPDAFRARPRTIRVNP